MHRLTLALRRRPETGASAVEFALVMPILLVLVFGLIQYGLYFWAVQGGADAARHAARLSAVGKPPACADFRSDVGDQVSRFSQGTPTITRTYTNAESNIAADAEIGDRVEVTVTFNSIDLNLPFVPFINDGQVSETVEARVDYAPVPLAVACP
jgi:Flp pilus assembly protein TadG